MGELQVRRANAIETRRFPWLEWILLLASQALFFQIFPGAWSQLLTAVRWILRVTWTVVDVRNWNSWGYVAGLAVILVFLIGLKAWKDRR